MFAAIVVVARRMMRLQQMIAIAMGENSMLSIDEETTSSTQRPPAHFEQLNGRIRGEDEILVSSYEHKNNGESTTDNHPVGYEWNGSWSEDSSQVDPSTDRWRQLANALDHATVGKKTNRSIKCLQLIAKL